MTTNNRDKLSKDDIVKLYSFLLEFENSIKNSYGCYNFDNDELVKFCKANNIVRKGNEKTKKENYFWFSAKKNHTIQMTKHIIFYGILEIVLHTV